MAPRLCWLGVGNMGKAMGRNLAERANLGQPLILWSRTFQHALDLHKAAENTEIADSLETAVAYGDIIWSCLSDDDAVKSLFGRIVATNDGKDNNLSLRGKLFVECSTVRPATANAVAADIIARGGEYVAMPFLGDPGMARSGVLVCMPAGRRESVDRVKPYLAGVLAQTVVDYGGEEPGKAALIKMIGNMSIVSIVESIAEAHVLADKTGLGSDRLEQFLDCVMPGPHMLYSRRFNTGAYYKSSAVVNVHMALKVAGLVMEAAKATGTAVPAYEIATKLMEQVPKEDGVTEDIGGMYGALRKASGMPYKNQ